MGLVSHFDGGTTVNFSDFFRMGASAYLVRASGEQRIISKVIQRNPNSGSSSGRGQSSGRNRVFETETEIVVPADIAKDHGFSTWFGVSSRSDVSLYAGYNRSMNYEFNSFFFGLGFRIGK